VKDLERSLGPVSSFKAPFFKNLKKKGWKKQKTLIKEFNEENITNSEWYARRLEKSARPSSVRLCSVHSTVFMNRGGGKRDPEPWSRRQPFEKSVVLHWCTHRERMYDE
jgi:hypothetical protein